jgi:hypothetical protein
LNHRHIKFVFLRSYCHACECHDSESKFLLVRAMKVYMGVLVWLHSFLTPALDGHEWSVSWVVMVWSLFCMGKHPWYLLTGRMGRSRYHFGCCGEKRNHFLLPGFELWFSQLSSLLHSFIPFELYWEPRGLHLNTLTRNQLCMTANVKVMFLQVYISLITLFVWVVMFQLCWGLWPSLFLCQISLGGLVKKRIWAVRIALPGTTAVSPFHCRLPCPVAVNVVCLVRPKALQTQHM